MTKSQTWNLIALNASPPICLVFCVFFFGKLWCLSQIAYFQIRNNTRSLPQGNNQDELLEMTGIEVQLQSPVTTREWLSDRRALRWEGSSVRRGVSHSALPLPSLVTQGTLLNCICASTSLHINQEYENLPSSIVIRVKWDNFYLAHTKAQINFSKAVFFFFLLDKDESSPLTYVIIER